MLSKIKLHAYYLRFRKAYLTDEDRKPPSKRDNLS